MSDPVTLALIAAIISTIVGPIVVFFVNRANQREDWRRQDAVADKVAKVAELAATSNETLKSVAATGEATHRIVNSQRTVMLRTIAVSARALANAYPGDLVLLKAADDAEHDLAENVKENTK